MQLGKVLQHVSFQGQQLSKDGGTWLVKCSVNIESWPHTLTPRAQLQNRKRSRTPTYPARAQVPSFSWIALPNSHPFKPLPQLHFDYEVFCCPLRMSTLILTSHPRLLVDLEALSPATLWTSRPSPVTSISGQKVT